MAHDIDRIEFIKPKISGGAYLDPDFVKTYWELVLSLHSLIPDDRSHGNLSLTGVAAKCRARVKAVADKAKTMENMMKAVTSSS